MFCGYQRQAILQIKDKELEALSVFVSVDERDIIIKRVVLNVLPVVQLVDISEHLIDPL